MLTLNLTQHPATPAQISAGVVDLDDASRQRLCAALTFEDLPTPGDILERALVIASLASLEVWERAEEAKADGVNPYPFRMMIGGAGFFVAALAKRLQLNGFEVVHAFSKRMSEETTLADGSVRKVASFVHAGFVPHVPD